MAETTQLTTGELFAGKYRIKRLLGEGGMGAVYEAENVALRCSVALKILSAELAAVQTATQRFVREGIATSRVRHRAIVQVFDAGEYQGLPWLAMEVLHGQTLGQKLKEHGPLPADEVLRLAKELVAGVGAAHAQGIVHRDLKPQNIVLDDSESPPQPKILDFGIAKLSDNALPKLTQAGLMMGTPHYMAPEQALGKDHIGVAADFWALGVILLEVLTGELPFCADTVPEYLGLLVSQDPRDVRALAPNAPPELTEAIQACLRHDPDKRPQSAESLLAILKGQPQDMGSASTLFLAPGSDSALSAHPDRGPETQHTSAETPVSVAKKGGGQRSHQLLVLLPLVALFLPLTCGIATIAAISRCVCASEPAAVNVAAAPAAPPEVTWDPAPEPPEPQLPLRPILIDSVPRNGRVHVNGEQTREKTPALIHVSNGTIVEVKRRGYEHPPQVVTPDQERLDFKMRRARRRRGRGKREKQKQTKIKGRTPEQWADWAAQWHEDND